MGEFSLVYTWINNHWPTGNGNFVGYMSRLFLRWWGVSQPSHSSISWCTQLTHLHHFSLKSLDDGHNPTKDKAVFDSTFGEEKDKRCSDGRFSLFHVHQVDQNRPGRTGDWRVPIPRRDLNLLRTSELDHLLGPNRARFSDTPRYAGFSPASWQWTPTINLHAASS